MAKAIDLDKLTYAELKDLRERIDDALAAAAAAEKLSVRAQMEALAANSGFTLAELIGNKRGAKRGAAGVVKFRNPKDPSQTWSGRGRKPNWLTEAEKKGQKLESFAI